MDIVTKICVWASPALFATVIYLMLDKFGKMDKKIDKQDAKVEGLQATVNQIDTKVKVDLVGFDRLNEEIKRHIHWLEESKKDYIKIIHMDHTLERHEKALNSAGRIIRHHDRKMKEFQEKIQKLEGENEKS